MPRACVLTALFVVLTLAGAGPAWTQARTLHWRELAVQAHLDEAGHLHVTERHVMVFSGDWNGGERSFRVGVDQELDVRRLVRIDPRTGDAIPLQGGNIDQVDRYAWEGNSLRWRSRLPSDPPFDEAALTYVIEYTLSNVLWKEDGVYRLSHDFAFPDREWPIRRFVLDFELAPAWEAVDEIPRRAVVEGLAPGESFVVRTALRRTGAEEGAVAIRRSVLPTWQKALPFAVALGVMLWMYARFRRREEKLGRFEPLPVPEQPDEAWLEANVFRYRPEEIGALWDRSVGPPEVAATLARLVAEGKLASEIVPRGRFRKPLLRLRRLAPRVELAGYEGRLVDKLFFDERTEVDTDQIREHYRARGFDPASEIEEELGMRLARHRELWGVKRPPDARPTMLLWLAVAGLIGLDLFAGWQQALILPLLALLPIVFLVLLGTLGARAWRSWTDRLDLRTLAFIAPAAGVFLSCVPVALWGDLFPNPGEYTPQPGPFGLLAVALTPVAVFRFLLNQAHSRETPGTVQRRRELAGIRLWFRRELEKPEPALRDEWFPYLLAFGLQKDVAGWFRAFGGTSRSALGSTLRTSSGSSTFGGSGGSAWTGGGGAFGGAGATSSWAVAAGSMAAGVSSASSGGGGGGGGGSSGGGGGGGW